MTKDEALQMCLEYIETDAHERKYVRHAIKKALAAPVQEPVPACWQGEDGCPNRQACCDAQHCLYTTPLAQRQWVGLTEQERNAIEDYCEMIVGKPVLEAIEAKLKEKNT